VCDLLWRLPKDDVPFVIVREEVDEKTVVAGRDPGSCKLRCRLGEFSQSRTKLPNPTKLPFAVEP
jgi:hypothetical protein